MKLPLPLLLLAISLFASGSRLSAKQMFTPQPVSSVDELASRLEQIRKFDCQASTSVSMSQMTDDVAYDLHLIQQAADSVDPLSTTPFLIEWTMTAPRSGHSGFSAYYSGNHYRYSGQRLQEYHLPADSAALRPFGSPDRGLHRSVQFFNFLPQGIASELRSMAADSNWHIDLRRDTLVSGRRALAIHALRTIDGTIASRADYIFDPSTAMPRRIAIENNPGAVNEQSVYVNFSDCPYLDLDPDALPYTISEQWLAARFPDQFSRRRQSTFTIDKLPGQLLPGFALPTSTGERYARRTGDPFRCPTLLVLLSADDSPASVSQLIADLRSAAAGTSVDIIWAFVDRNVDAIEPLVGQLLPGEHLLISAGSLLRDCGATRLPALILADREGKVVKIATEVNNAALSDVIEVIK